MITGPGPHRSSFPSSRCDPAWPARPRPRRITGGSALSVFSHLERDMQRAWLSEMTRLLQPEGAFYLTFSGHYVFDKFKDEFPVEVVSEFEATGFSFLRNMGTEFYKYPEWYQTSLQEIVFMANELPKELRMVYYAARGHVGLQDALLCV